MGKNKPLIFFSSQIKSNQIKKITKIQVAADFFSGFVHWFGDSWSGYGYDSLFQDFLEHHDYPTAMVKRNYIEGAYDTYIIYMVIRLIGIVPHYPLLICTSMWAMQSNYFHRESHRHANRNWLVTKLQDMHIILNPIHHHIHHTKPFNNYYCVFSGFCNPMFELINFWRNFEKLIFVFTNLKSVEMRRVHPNLASDLAFVDRIKAAYKMKF